MRYFKKLFLLTIARIRKVRIRKKKKLTYPEQCKRYNRCWIVHDMEKDGYIHKYLQIFNGFVRGNIVAFNTNCPKDVNHTGGASRLILFQAIKNWRIYYQQVADFSRRRVAHCCCHRGPPQTSTVWDEGC
jgi:hypothetical protein